jgi:selenide,water dikinase
VCRGSKLAARIDWERMPLLPGVLELLQAGHRTGASGRNWAGYGAQVDLGRHGDLQRDLLSDPQTSGGLLVTCAPEAVDEVLGDFRAEGFARACVIGEMLPGEPRVGVA